MIWLSYAVLEQESFCLLQIEYARLYRFIDWGFEGFKGMDIRVTQAAHRYEQ